MNISVSSGANLVFIKFRIRGNLRFLSHAETLVMFHRALLRASIPVRYSEGFNPHQRLSLPLPRSVGVEAEDDILCVKINAGESAFDAEDFKARVCAQLPEGCEITEVGEAASGASFNPAGAVYELKVHQDYLGEKLTGKIENILARKSITIPRQIDARGTLRNVDVRPYIDSISVRDDLIMVGCNISPAGAIRVDEIMSLLGIDTAMLAGPVRRTSIKWTTN